MSKSRRELARAYREAPRTAGVGSIRNRVNGKVLLLASTDIPSLLNRHLAQLRLGVHHNVELQADWLDAGSENFTLQVLDTLPPPKDQGADIAADVAVLEALWLEKLSPFAPAGYNAPRKSA